MADWVDDRPYRAGPGEGTGRGGGRYYSNSNPDYRGGGRGYRGRGGGRNTNYDSGGRYYSGQNQATAGNYYGDDGGGYRGGGGAGGSARGRGRQSRGRADWGRSHYQNRPRPPREDEQLPADLSLMATLPAHEAKITCLAFDQATAQLYTGSQDGTVKSWNSATGAIVSSVEVGGSVDSILLGGGFLFVGLHKGQEGIIKVWNMSTGSNHLLTGHKGQVLGLVIGGTNLFSCGQDSTIRVWTYNSAAGIFVPQVIIAKEDGGHSSGVQALVVSGAIMYSACQAGTIKAWDLASGKCVQTLLGAHKLPIMQLLIFEGFLLSAGLDGLIKCWQLLDPPGPDAVIRRDAEFVFDKTPQEDEDESQPANRRQWGGAAARTAPPGVLQMHGAVDAAQQPILMVTYNGENCVRLFDLPNFAPRGVLPQVDNARGIVMVPGSAILTGDVSGQVKVFAWTLQPNLMT